MRDVELVVASGDRAHPGYRLSAWEVTAVTETPAGDWQLLVDTPDRRRGFRSVNRIQYTSPACVPADPSTDNSAALRLREEPVNRGRPRPSGDADDSADATLDRLQLGDPPSSG